MVPSRSADQGQLTHQHGAPQTQLREENEGWGGRAGGVGGEGVEEPSRQRIICGLIGPAVH